MKWMKNAAPSQMNAADPFKGNARAARECAECTANAGDLAGGRRVRAEFFGSCEIFPIAAAAFSA